MTQGVDPGPVGCPCYDPRRSLADVAERRGAMTETDVSDGSLLSLGQAAKLTGVRRNALERRVRQGEIGVRILGTGKAAKLRVTLAALGEAGLLPPADPPAPVEQSSTNGPAVAADLAVLLALIREQGTRIASLEDQRFRLADELGAAIERARLVEERMRALGESPVPQSPVDVSVLPSDDRAAPDGRPGAAMGSAPAGRERSGSMAIAHGPIDEPAIEHASGPGITLPRAVGADRRDRRQPTRVIRWLGRAWRARRRATLRRAAASARDD